MRLRDAAMKLSKVASVLCAVLTLAACSSSHGRFSDAGAGEPCGPTTCGPGTECCNASCGVCVEPGGGCSAIACVDAGGPTCGRGACAPADRCCPGCAPGEDFCVPGRSPCPDLVCPPPNVDAGPSCGGESCAPGQRCCIGCTDEGSFCRPLDEPCPDIECPPPLTDGGADGGADAGTDGGTGATCGGRVGSTCGSTQYCDFAGGSYCGAADEPGTCRARPEDCDDSVCLPVCGCDGITYCSACEAHAAGTDVAIEGECSTTDPDCAPMEARGVGACDAFFGWAWDGDRCAGLSGCDCEGADCEAAFETREQCDEAYAGCIEDCRTTGCPSGSRCILCWADYACVPDGAVC